MRNTMNVFQNLKNFTTKIWKSSWGLGNRDPTRTVPWLFTVPSLSHSPRTERGEGVTLLQTASIAGLVQSSNSGSCQPLLFCGLSRPPRLATPFTNHAPMMQHPTLIHPTPHHCWKNILRGQWHLKGGRGVYIDWGKDGCVIIIG